MVQRATPASQAAAHPGAVSTTLRAKRCCTMERMDRRAELSAYLRSRRARIRPDEVGLPEGLGRRRVPGLRREELALLAGVSADYYVQLEQGRVGAVSDAVLDAVARALRLDDDERDHLHRLARPVPSRRRRRKRPRVRPGLQRLLDSFELHPAYVVGPGTEVLAWNRLACGVWADFDRLEPGQRNMARFVYLEESWRDLYDDWEAKADDVVAFLRFQAGHDPDDPDLAALVGELSVKSEEFRRRWAGQAVRDKTHGTVRLHNPIAGELELAWETFRAPGEDDQALIVYTAAPGSVSEAGLRVLSSWLADDSRIADHRERLAR
jgi:transcriptional regulator with XRE-family HTH domain